MKKVLCIIFDGFEELEATGPITLLKRAGANVDICSIEEKVIGKHNLCFSNILNLGEINYMDYDMLFIPGGPHYASLEKNAEVIKIINYYYNSKKPIASICAAPTILGRLGMLKNRNYTCFTSMNDNFGGTYIDKYVVKDDFIISARSAAASIELGLCMIKYLFGENIEDEIKQSIYY